MTSTIIDALALIVSILGLIITGCTMKSAKKIQEEMEKMRIDTLDKSRFITFKPNAIKKIDSKLKSIRGAQKLSKNICMDIMTIFAEAEGFESVLRENDYKLICELHKKIGKLCTKKGAYDDTDITNCINMLIQLNNILEKGDYAL